MISPTALDVYGINWMGPVPATWLKLSVKRRYAIQLGKMLQNDPASQRDVLVPYARALHVLWGKVQTDDLPNMWANPADIEQYGIKDKDLLVCEGGEAGRAGIVLSPPHQCIIQNALHRVRSMGSDSVQFLRYVLHAVNSAGWIDVLCNKATIAHFTREKFADLRIPLPSQEEQHRITAFLDRETERIDTLIAKKERQIELLQEKRSALISHVVTKGLDPNAKMKDSRIEWLGEIPESWRIVKLKWATRDIVAGPFGSSLTKDMYTKEGMRVYGQEQVIPDDFSKGDYYISKDKYFEMRRYAVNAGDVLVSCVGTFGKVAVVPTNAEPGIINPRLIMVHPESEIILPNYLGLLLKSDLCFSQMDQASRGGTMDVINIALLSELWLPIPTISEQVLILDHANREANSINTFIDLVTKSMERLREYRTALISAAVTGKIDVREEVA